MGHSDASYRKLFAHKELMRDLLAAGGLPDRNLVSLVLRMGRSNDLEQWRSLLHTLRQVVAAPGSKSWTAV